MALTQRRYGEQKSVGVMLARTVIVGAALSGVGYLAMLGIGGIVGLVRGDSYTMEAGYVDPKNVQIAKVKNQAGNVESFMDYKGANGSIKLAIREGPGGPLVGDADYNWKGITDDVKSRLVGGSWDHINIETRKTILKKDLDKLMESYK